MTHRGPFQPQPFCDSVTTGSSGGICAGAACSPARCPKVMSSSLHPLAEHSVSDLVASGGSHCCVSATPKLLVCVR